MQTKIYQNLIGGQWVSALSGKTFLNRNPANVDDVVGEFQASGEADVDRAVKAARAAYKQWRLFPAPKRGEILYRAGELLLRHKEKLARQMTGAMCRRQPTLLSIWRGRGGGSLGRRRRRSCATSLPCLSACLSVSAA